MPRGARVRLSLLVILGLAACCGSESVHLIAGDLGPTVCRVRKHDDGAPVARVEDGKGILAAGNSKPWVQVERAFVDLQYATPEALDQRIALPPCFAFVAERLWHRAVRVDDLGRTRPVGRRRQFRVDRQSEMLPRHVLGDGIVEPAVCQKTVARLCCLAFDDVAKQFACFALRLGGLFLGCRGARFERC